MLERVWQLVRENWLTLLVIVGLPVAFFTLRSQSTPMASSAEFEDRIRSGQPVVVEVFSNS